MLHNRQAPGRDFHKHFSLAPARSDTNPTSNPQSAPAPSLLQDRAQARNATSRAPHLSLIPLTPSAPSRLRPPTPAPLPRPCPPSTSMRRRLERHIMGRKGHRRASSWDARDSSYLNHNATHPPLRPCTALCIVGLPDARTRVCARSAAIYGWEPPTLIFASVLYCMVMLLPPLPLGSRRGDSDSGSGSTVR